MRTSRYLFLLFVALVFGLSFAVPAEDVPGTAYDESESLPYEGALPPSVVLAEFGQAVGAAPVGRRGSRPALSRDPVLAQYPLAERPASDSLVILERPLRC